MNQRCTVANDPRGHRDRVELPDGTAVVARSFPVEGYASDTAPNFGLYLDRRWQPPWPHTHLNWPDFGLPVSNDAMIVALEDVLDRARNGQTIELGCLGGHGRTGTALACLAIMAGLTTEPVDWIRSVYCQRAIETTEQETFARRFVSSWS